MPEQEKTEQPTPRRREKAREEGQIPQSDEINSALILITCWLVLWFYGGSVLDRLQSFTSHIFFQVLTLRVDSGNIMFLVQETFYFWILLLIPIFIGVTAAGLFSNLIQVGFLFSGKPVMPSLSRLNPIEGAKRILSKRALVELAKASIKALTIGYAAYSVIRAHVEDFFLLGHMSLQDAVRLTASVTVNIVFRVALILLVLSIFDYLYQRWENEQQLKMTKQEVKEEKKQTEGDPGLRQRIKSKQQEMARMRMMQAVPDADVIITNPVRLAVAVKYEPQQMTAPVVVAKGQRKVAEKIRKLAKENDIVIVEDRELARTLYKTTEVDEQIPLELYQAVAEVLAFVYRINEEKGSYE